MPNHFVSYSNLPWTGNTACGNLMELQNDDPFEDKKLLHIDKQSSQAQTSYRKIHINIKKN